MQKLVLGLLELHDGRQKQKAMEAISILHGINRIEVDMEKQEMTVVGTVDPFHVVQRLRKKCFRSAWIVHFGPDKEEVKIEDSQVEEVNKGDDNPAPVYTPCYPPPQHLQTYCPFCGSTLRFTCPFCSTPI